ncbi:hypothetical protein COD67_09885 [Bacillus cereus]|nr:hypothetical protein COI89_07985 [Bacillus cereus]PGU67466.1 hypothetical protein COD67_09885 [Bacillus cereus]
MIDSYYIENRVIGGVSTLHGAQATIHALQHMPYYHHSPAIPHYQVIQYHPFIGYIPLIIYPTIFTTTSFY